MYRLDFGNESFICNDWSDVESHPNWRECNIFQKMPFGWLAI